MNQIYLDYVLFLKRLTKRAEELAIRDREQNVSPDHFREAAEVRVRLESECGVGVTRVYCLKPYCINR